MTRTLTCKQAIAVLMDYVDGTLAAPTSRDIDAHLAICPRCEEFVRSYAATPGVVRRATTPRVSPAGLRKACAAAVARARATRPARS